MSDIEDRVHAIECKVSELGVLTKRAMDAIQTLEDCQLVRLSPKQPEPAPEPYRMTRPTNFGTAVIDDGVVWRLAPNGLWGADEYAYQNEWDDITDPQPFQNCVLTADDPEPPIGSVVRAITGLVRERSGRLWRAPWGGAALTWASVAASPVTLLYRGEA